MIHPYPNHSAIQSFCPFNLFRNGCGQFHFHHRVVYIQRLDGHPLQTAKPRPSRPEPKRICKQRKTHCGDRRDHKHRIRYVERTRASVSLLYAKHSASKSDPEICTPFVFHLCGVQYEYWNTNRNTRLLVTRFFVLISNRLTKVRSSGNNGSAALSRGTTAPLRSCIPTNTIPAQSSAYFERLSDCILTA